MMIDVAQRWVKERITDICEEEDPTNGTKQFLENWYSKTTLKWKSEPADQKDTLQTEIGKEESASSHIPIVTEEKLL